MIRYSGNKPTALTLILVLLAPLTLLASDVDSSVVATTPHFAFYSDFATNVHDALIVAGADRNKNKPGLNGPAFSVPFRG